MQVRDIISHYVRDAEELNLEPDEVWSFAPIPGASVTLDTGRGIRRYADELRDLGAEDMGETDEGFVRLRLPLASAPDQSLANPEEPTYVKRREVGAGERLANPVRSGRKQP